MDTNPLLQRVDRMLGDAFPKLNKLRADEYFVDSDALSSYDILEFLLMIEKEFDLKVPDPDVTEENFGSKRAIAAYLGRRIQSTAA
jgi:acyl carrier protein